MALKPDKRQRILKAATHVFANYGFYNAKISQIARLADVADGTIYLYFKSKDDILISIFEEEMEVLIDVHRKAVEAPGSASDKLMSFAETYAKTAMENEDLTAFIQLEIRQSAKFQKNYKNEQLGQFLNIIGSTVQSGMDSGEFETGLNPNMVKHAFFGAIDEISTQWILMPVTRRFDLVKSITDFARIFSRGIKS